MVNLTLFESGGKARFLLSEAGGKVHFSKWGKDKVPP